MSSFIIILGAATIFAAASVSEGHSHEKRGLLDSALKSVVQPLGAVENAVSPDAMNSFCKQNGYTLWVGDGPEPKEAEGLVNSAWSGWGKLTGAAVGAWAPEGVMMGKCEPLGWAKPGSDYARTHAKTTTTYMIQGQPGTYQPGTPGSTVTYVTPGQPGTYQPGTPGTTTTYVTPGQPGTYQPGNPGTTTTYVTPGQPGTYQPGTPPTTTQYVTPGQPGTYQPGTPPTTTTYVTPGRPGTYQPGTPPTTTTIYQPPQQPQTQQMCQCPCQG